jgi:hypothetical protein
MQDIFEFERTGISARGEVVGSFHGRGLPRCLDRLRGYGVHLSKAIFNEVVEVHDKTKLLRCMTNRCSFLPLS